MAPRAVSRESPEASSKSGCTLIDTTLPLDELIQRLSNVLVFRRVPHHARPFASGALIDFLRFCGAQNDSSERVITAR
jgi:hypothetical protein